MGFSSFTAVSPQAALDQLKSTPLGLSSQEAANRLQAQGSNEISGHKTTVWQLWLRQFKSPFIYLLGGAALISFCLHDTTEGALILLFIAINTLLAFSQEYHSAKALEILKQFVVTNARVRREVIEQLVPSQELVTGDIILLEAGDVIPADVRLLETQACVVDESILTGEAIQVIKTTEALPAATEQPYEAKNILFSGTTLVSGRAMGVVIATANQTILGSISTLTNETAHQSSFEKNLANFSRFILKLVITTLVLMFVAHLAIPGQAENPLELLLFSIALAVSVIPEALPVVTTISLSKGALRLAKNKVVVKRLSAIEDLGSIEVLCTDKTGTITENRLAVKNIQAIQPEQTLWYATLPSSHLGDIKQQSNNSFDIALWQACHHDIQAQLTSIQRLAEIPFDPIRRCNSALVQEGTHSVLVLRGAAEIVLKSCLETQESEHHLLAWASEEGKQGRRVLAVATKAMGSAKTYNPSQEEHGFHLHGLISFEDPIKASTTQAIQQAQALGVMVKILTGDSAEVAGSVARTIGLIKDEEKVMTGVMFESLNEADRLVAARTHHVFARVSPEQKHAVIRALEQSYEVGFLGEGINDAPALKAANIGIVVQGASDVAREAADVVLLEQSLGVIIGGIQEGREVFANTLKYIKATLAANFGNFYAVAIASFLIKSLPMLPIQILMVNLLSDFPMIAIATDRVDIHELSRPRSYQVKEIIKFATVLGLTSTVFDFLFFGLFWKFESSVLQTNWFMGSILTELVFIYSIRTNLPFWKAKRPPFPLVALTGLAALATIILPYTTVGQTAFHFHPPSSTHLALILGIVLIYFVTTELVKLMYQAQVKTKSVPLTSS